MGKNIMGKKFEGVKPGRYLYKSRPVTFGCDITELEVIEISPSKEYIKVKYAITDHIEWIHYSRFGVLVEAL